MATAAADTREAPLEGGDRHGSLAFDLPDTLVAHEPPEVRGLARDGVRLLVSDARDDVRHATARNLPDYLRAGDVVVVNRGVEHELYSEGGMTFVEALSPVLRDHVPDVERDLVLGEQGDTLHAAN